ncbi:hypothetical protein PPYR_11073 [Photinus pyralis]|uniref:Peptidase S1 domain-containing protein n=1 Tax=Photinus pyralis TaxID=7054 RepID=A0A5N4AI39_PHOPY|nr:chymotrypsin-1-like [Photinus pyralis]KAB0797012.1 hypothetical protein PPYR_11073 [Photinus pyralis]
MVLFLTKFLYVLMENMVGGGSIIDATTILTAGHCLRGFDELPMHITVGSNTLDQGGDSYEVSERRPHELFDLWTTGVKYDIGIAKLKTPIVFNEKVKPVKFLSETYVGTSVGCVLSGWGMTKYPGEPANELHYLDLVNFSLEKCSEMWKDKYLMPIDDSQICTFAMVGQGGCQFDSGGPLVSGGGIQIGIVSMGDPCATGMPDVFTRVSHYRDWIEKNRQ